MAVTATPGQAKTMTLATTLTLINGLSPCRTVDISVPSGVTVHIVDVPGTADGASVTTDRMTISGPLVYVYELSGAPLLIAASTGTPTIWIRPI